MHLGCIVLSLLALQGVLCEDEEPKEKKAEPVPDVVYNIPKPAGFVYIAEHFDDIEAFKERWVTSEATKDGAEDNIAKYNGKWEVEGAEKSHLRGDLGLALKSKAHHHAIAAKLNKPFVFDHKTFVLQYEVQFQNGQDCGGAYIKVLSDLKENEDLKKFNDKSPYTIMFGPDKCGTEHKLHFIFRHRNPVNGTYEEKHWKKTSTVNKFDEIFKDKKSHLFTLIIKPDNTFEILVDRRSEAKGSLLEDFSPPVNPPKEIEDPDDRKPEDWDEREKVPDPAASKPDDWDEDAPRQIPDPDAKKPVGWLDDEPQLVPDATAQKPKDWDDDMDGEWEAPLVNNPKCAEVGCGEWKPPTVDNPKYKGKWRAPLIDNPNYKGKWKPRKIPNPRYYEDLNPYRMTSVGAVGFELWSMSDNILFDNVVIADDPVVTDQWATDTWVLKKEAGDRETTPRMQRSRSWWFRLGWLLYVTYAGIPIGSYVYYILKMVQEEDGMFVRLLKYTEKYPWLWAVYTLVIGLPVVLFICFCCTSSSSSKTTAAAAKHKKSDDAPLAEEDQPHEDDEKAEGSNAVIEEEEEDQGEGGPAEVVSNEEGTLQEEAGAGDKEAVESTSEEGSGEGEEVSQEEAQEDGGAGDSKKSPRRRRPRRE